MNSPFGTWAPLVAVAVCILVIACALVQHMFGTPDPFIDNLAFAAFGLAIGAGGTASVATNGIKHTLDSHEAEISNLKTAVVTNTADIATNTGDIASGR